MSVNIEQVEAALRKQRESGRFEQPVVMREKPQPPIYRVSVPTKIGGEEGIVDIKPTAVEGNGVTKVSLRLWRPCGVCECKLKLERPGLMTNSGLIIQGVKKGRQRVEDTVLPVSEVFSGRKEDRRHLKVIGVRFI